MKIITHYKLWWFLLIVSTFAVSALTSVQVEFVSLLISVAAHLLFAIVVATIPLLVYWLIGRPLNTEQMMSTITAGWLILAVANLAV